MGVEPEDDLVSDKELKSLLERWVAPGPSRVLDKRIETSFAREFSGADGLSQSVLLPQRREEVVSMKFCSKCEEQFADKFSFCPVDGTPLTVAAAAAVEEPSLTVSRDDSSTAWAAPTDSSTKVPETPTPPVPPNSNPIVVPVAASASASALALREEYHLTIMDDSGLAARLGHEIKDVAHEY